MKKLLTLGLALSLLSQPLFAEVDADFKSPDILVDAQFGYDWSTVLVPKVRQFLKNNGMADPFKQNFKQPITVTEATVGSYLKPDAKELATKFGSMVGLDLLKAKTKVQIHNLSVDITGFKTEFENPKEDKDGIRADLNFSASNVHVIAEKITLSLEVPTAGAKGATPVLEVQVVRPQLSATETDLIRFLAQIKIQDFKDHHGIVINQSSFEPMARDLMDNPKALDLCWDKIIVPNLDIKVGNKKVEFYPEKVEALINSKREAIKNIVMAQLALQLKSGIADSALKVMEKIKLKKENWVSTGGLHMQFLVNKFTSRLMDNNLELSANADFCTDENFKENSEKCVETKLSQPYPSRINWNLHARSMRFMQNLVNRGNAAMVASISEDYVNKLLGTFGDNGLLNKAVESAGIILGPNKVFIRMDEEGDFATVYMDVLAKPKKKIESIALGTKEIRFPLILKVFVRIEKNNTTPVLKISIKDVDTSDDTLKNGRPEIGVVSNVHTLRLQKKVLETIRAELAGLQNKELLKLELKNLKDSGLENIDFVSDGFGRMHAFIRLEDFK